MKLSTELKKLGIKGTSASTVSPCGTLSSNTMMVMMMAMTPSLKASSLVLFTLVRLRSKPLPPHDGGNHRGQQEYQEKNGEFFGNGIAGLGHTHPEVGRGREEPNDDEHDRGGRQGRASGTRYQFRRGDARRPEQKAAHDDNGRPHSISPGFRYAASEPQAQGEFNEGKAMSSSKWTFAVSAMSYMGKIPARTGRPAFSYIRTAAAASTRPAVSTSGERRPSETHKA